MLLKLGTKQIAFKVYINDSSAIHPHSQHECHRENTAAVALSAAAVSLSAAAALLAAAVALLTAAAAAAAARLPPLFGGIQ